MEATEEAACDSLKENKAVKSFSTIVGLPKSMALARSVLARSEIRGQGEE